MPAAPGNPPLVLSEIGELSLKMKPASALIQIKN
jgi:hypothetical protein